MIGYVTLGSNDMDKALAFYDALLGTIGGKQLITMPDARRFTLYGNGRGNPMIAVTKPYDGGAASPGNGTMVALGMADRAQVDAFHAKGIELGAVDEGAPGVRGVGPGGEFYGAYVRDPDGNKLCAYKIG